ncbi:MAG TPA: hypothetical protein VHC19_14575 [Pirellulales bacterium]|nr:hypothetical protein [Pirellulales bacterium]
MSASFFRRATSGALAGVLLFAAFNALSYFALSPATKLLGGTRDGGRIGFPAIVWESSGRGVGTFHSVALLQNVAVGLAASAAFGMVVALATRGRTSPGWSSVAESRRPKALRIARQFSLRGMLLTITALAVVLALGQQSQEQTKLRLLLAIYALGPSLVIAVYGIARRFTPNTMGTATTSVAALTVSAALVLGAGSGIRDMTQVLLGLFVYWTPQCVLLAVCLLAWTAWRTLHCTQ